MVSKNEGQGSEDASLTDEKGGITIAETVPRALFNAQATDRYNDDFTHIDEAKLVRKIDLHLIPMLAVLYTMAFLDRINIGNAVVLGLPQDLHLVGNQLNIALVIFFVPFALFDIPSNILLKRFKPHLWLAVCLLLFGIITIAQGLTHNFKGILAARFFLGFCESGMFPGCYYLISMWYRRTEAQTRYSFFFSSTSLAAAFGGLIAFGLGHLGGVRGMAGWRWVFIIEGLITCTISIVVYFLLPDWPEDASWLTEDEKAFMKFRLQEDAGEPEEEEPLTFKKLVGLLVNVKALAAGVMYFGVIVPGYSFAYFSPTIIQSLGHNPITTQLLSVPPYVAAFVLSMITATLSDRLQHRFTFIIGNLLISLAGLIMLFVVHHSPNVQYGALFLMASGLYSSMPITLCWYNMNVRGRLDRAISLGYQIGFGSIGGIVSSFSFLAKDAPRYTKGYSICTGAMVLSIIMATVYLISVMVENGKRNKRTNSEDGREYGLYLMY
ncbi:major facilitator protein [Abortiporus biennis]|nr:major facilitator protein [Abortiporus biennis]